MGLPGGLERPTPYLHGVRQVLGQVSLSRCLHSAQHHSEMYAGGAEQSFGGVELVSVAFPNLSPEMCLVRGPSLAHHEVQSADGPRQSCTSTCTIFVRRFWHGKE